MGEAVSETEGVSDQVWSVAFSPDGQHALWEAVESSALGPADRWELLLWVQARRMANIFQSTTMSMSLFAASP